MSRLEAARAALADLAELEQDDPDFVIPTTVRGALQLAIQRMAQLEKVAELARTAVDDAGVLVSPQDDALLTLDLALIELDNHPDTREPTTTEETPR